MSLSGHMLSGYMFSHFDFKNLYSKKAKFILLASLFVMLPMGATIAELSIDYFRTKKHTEVLVSDMTNVVERNIKDMLVHVDTLLVEVGKNIIQDKGTSRMLERARWEQLNAFCRSISGCTVIGVINPDGQAAAISSVNRPPNLDVSDRNYFRQAKHTGNLYIDAAIVSRVPGNPIVFNISKPVFDSTGKLLAVVSMGMNTDHLTDFFKLMGFSLNPTVTVFKGNGDIVARNPDMHKHVGKNNLQGPLFSVHLKRAPHGVYDSVSTLDGKTRIAAYRAVPELDLVIFAGIIESSAFEIWRERALHAISAIGTVIAILLGLLLHAYRSVLRNDRLKAVNRELDHLSNSDGLTGIANRRAFDDALTRDWAHHQRSGQALSVLMLDVDYFKKYNDEYGHLAGDECLRRVAHTLQKCMQRKADFAARYGGEEFAVILNADEQGARSVAQRLCNAVEEMRLPHCRSDVSQHVTVSIGVATAAGQNVADAASLVGLADQALYDAKRQGRNRACSAAQSGSSMRLAG